MHFYVLGSSMLMVCAGTTQLMSNREKNAVITLFVSHRIGWCNICSICYCVTVYRHCDKKKLVNCFFVDHLCLYASLSVSIQPQGIGEPSVYHAVVVIFLEFFAWGLLTTPMLTVSPETHAISRRHTVMQQLVIYLYAYTSLSYRSQSVAIFIDWNRTRPISL